MGVEFRPHRPAAATPTYCRLNNTPPCTKCGAPCAYTSLTPYNHISGERAVPPGHDSCALRISNTRKASKYRGHAPWRDIRGCRFARLAHTSRHNNHTPSFPPSSYRRFSVLFAEIISLTLRQPRTSFANTNDVISFGFSAK